MNKKQKIVATIGIILIVIVLIIWQAQGGETLTKTQVLIDKTTDLDRMLGVENKQYVDKYIFGILPSGMGSVYEILSASTLSGFVVVLSGVLIYLFRNKKKGIK